MPTMSTASRVSPFLAWCSAKASLTLHRGNIFSDYLSVQFHFHWILTTAMEGRYVALFYR